MAMIGRGAAIAEVGKRHHEIHGELAHMAWLGVHASLMTGTKAKIEAFVDWAWDGFSKTGGPHVLDRGDAAKIDWDDDDLVAASSARRLEVASWPSRAVAGCGSAGPPALLRRRHRPDRGTRGTTSPGTAARRREQQRDHRHHHRARSGPRPSWTPSGCRPSSCSRPSRSDTAPTKIETRQTPIATAVAANARPSCLACIR